MYEEIKELSELKEKVKQLERTIVDREETIEYLHIVRKDLEDKVRLEQYARKEEKEKYECIIAAYESGEVLKSEKETAKYYKECLGDAERELLTCERRLEELEACYKNPFGAGRKKDQYLEMYGWDCWDKGMSDSEIIGSTYFSYGEYKKVARATYYRAKKRLYDTRNLF